MSVVRKAKAPGYRVIFYSCRAGVAEESHDYNCVARFVREATSFFTFLRQSHGPHQFLDIIPDIPLAFRIAQQVGRVIGGHDLYSHPVVKTTPQAGNRLLGFLCSEVVAPGTR